MSKTKTYEGMFLVQSGSDFHAASQPINTVLERSEAEILSMHPWEERRLAYEIQGHKRGLYILTYFKMDPAKLSDLHRDSKLNEGVLRMMILRRDKITDEEVNAQTPAEAVQKQAEASEAAAAEAAEAAAAPVVEDAPVAEEAVAEAGVAEAVVAEAVVEEAAAEAVVEEAVPEAVVEEAVPEAVVEEAPSEAVVEEAPPEAVVEEAVAEEAEPKASDEA